MRWTARMVVEDYIRCIRTGRWHDNMELSTLQFRRDGRLFSRVPYYREKVIALPVPSVDGKPTVIVDKSIWRRSSRWGRKLARVFDDFGVRQLETITQKVDGMIGLTDNPVLWAASFSSFPAAAMERLVAHYSVVRGIPSSSKNWLDAAKAVRKARRLNHKVEMMFRCHKLAQGELDDNDCIDILDSYREACSLLNRIDANIRYLKKCIHRFADDPILAMPNEVGEMLRKLNAIASDKGLWSDRLGAARLIALDYIDKRPSGLLFLGKMLRHGRFAGMVLDRNSMPDIFTLLSLLLKYGRYEMIELVLLGRAVPSAELLRFIQIVKGKLKGSRKDIYLPATSLHVDTNGKVFFVVEHGEKQMASIDPVLVKRVLETLSGGHADE